ncbi:hypothetical protein VTJ83DRAFT_2746 [Remersonia thermophila]|uniref:Uncharacterized protein n=1 Tax=Remersonia thermophila TaxID=72144 RepID=A0ABR4DJT8_9PEZI
MLNMFDSSLHATIPLLINLHYTVHWATTSATAMTAREPTSPAKQYYSQRFPPVTFAADAVNLANDTGFGGSSRESWWGFSPPSPLGFLRSIDEACLARVRAALRHTPYAFDMPINYEIERWFVWTGLGGDEGKRWEGVDGDDGNEYGGVPRLDSTAARVNIRGLTAAELVCQLRMVAARGWRDMVRVEMAVEIEARAPREKRPGESLARGD